MEHNEQFIIYKKKASFDSDLADNNLKKTSVAFIEESGNEAIHTQNKTFTFIPSGGTNGNVLTSKNGKPVWGNISLLDSMSYGVEWDENQADPHLKRIGNINYHKNLPIQSQMKGCIYNPKTKAFRYWLDSNDWHYSQHTREMTSLKGTLPTAGDVRTIQITQDNTYAQGINIGQYIIFKGSYITETIAVVKGIETNGNITTLQLDYKEVDNTLTYDQIVSNLTNSSDGAMKTNVIIYVGSNLSGYDGEVMVYVPAFYIRSWEEGTKKSVRISTYKIDDTWEYQPALYLSAYKNTVLNTVPENMGYLSTLEVNSAISVVNDSPYCRGGRNTSTDDNDIDIFKRHLGKCRTNITRSDFRDYTRKTGKEIMSYKQYKNIMYWLYTIEYANFNSQDTFNDELTIEGFHQGGLGNGLTNVTNWNDYNVQYPISPNGYTNEFGNKTGIKLIEPNGPAPVGGIYTTRWRGLENTFGDVWHNVDGIIIDADVNNHSDGMRYVYTTDEPSKYGDTAADVANMILSSLEINKDGGIKEWDLGTTAEIIPKLIGGTETQYKCDYHWIGSNSTLLRTLLLGGRSNAVSLSGLSAYSSDSQVSVAAPYIGFRTSCIIQN